MISKVLHVCEAELNKRNENNEALPHAALAILWSLKTFLTLLPRK